jgi:hypothetical protein
MVNALEAMAVPNCVAGAAASVETGTSSADTAGAWHRTWPQGSAATIDVMADAASLDERLEQIGAQLDWVRDYL